MRLILAISVLSLVLPAICDEVGSLISEIEPLITEIPQLIEGEAPVIITKLAGLISEFAPTGVVSDLPALLQTNEAVIETFLDLAIEEDIPPGLLPSEILAEIPALVSAVVPEIVSELDGIISDLPGTLSDAAIPSLLASILPAIATEVEVIISAELPALSSFLENGGAPSTAPTTCWTKTTASWYAGSPTRVQLQVVTGAASAVAWHFELAGLIGFAVVVALL